MLNYQFERLAELGQLASIDSEEIQQDERELREEQELVLIALASEPKLHRAFVGELRVTEFAVFAFRKNAWLH